MNINATFFAELLAFCIFVSFVLLCNKVIFVDLSFNDIKFDYEFVSTGANSNHKKNRNFIDIRKSYNQSCLTFEVLVRGTVPRRAYEIFMQEGQLALFPLDNNKYQII